MIAQFLVRSQHRQITKQGTRAGDHAGAEILVQRARRVNVNIIPLEFTEYNEEIALYFVFSADAPA